MQPLTEEQQSWVLRHRDGDTPSTLQEDPETKRLFLLFDVAGRPQTAAQEIVDIEEADTYSLLLRVHVTNGSAGILVPSKDFGRSEKPGRDAVHVPITDSFLQEIRFFLRGAPVSDGGYVVLGDGFRKYYFPRQ